MSRLRATALLFACAGCSGSGSGDAGFDQPQIYPDNNPVCLSSKKVAVGESIAQPVLLQNEGRQDLNITQATIEMDTNMAFSVNGPTPMSVKALDSAIAQLRYTPKVAGWDAVVLRVLSNAQNYPQLDIYVLARAEPAGLDGGAFDAGPPPTTAMGACARPDAGM